MTTSYLNKLRRVSAHEAWASNRLGRGKALHWGGNADTQGYLTLRRVSEREPGGAWLHLDTAAGALALDSTNAEPWLNQLSEVPFVLSSVPATDGGEQAWYLQLYNQHLLAAFRQLLGHLQPLEPPPGDAHSDRHTYLLDWRIGDHSGQLLATLGEATLEQLLGRAQWQDISRLDIDDLVLDTPLCLGQLQLEKSEFRGLGIGDVILPTQPMFSAEGEGFVQLASVRLQLRHQSEGTQACYRVTHREEVAAGAPLEHDDHDLDASMEMPSVESSVTLSLNAGAISLTLKELSQLQEGSILVATGEAPGYATLYHRQRPVARGELVEVEGRLGVQLTQVLLPPGTADHTGGDDD
ncbi:FliM/FliN family flagellar motor switch protein [Billgrantia sp. Q4P2]|uniref:FliM/FliN family flagellar motor switch protein n=1 Tax=Billgrantia sp. Q4P2 TaxID=3463857 RepID=UPI0040576148